MPMLFLYCNFFCLIIKPLFLYYSTIKYLISHKSVSVDDFHNTYELAVDIRCGKGNFCVTVFVGDDFGLLKRIAFSSNLILLEL